MYVGESSSDRTEPLMLSGNNVNERGEISADKIPLEDNVDNIVTLLLESGMTGSDCAAILAHTPSIAMMRAQRNDPPDIAEKLERKYGGETLEETIDRVLRAVLYSTLKMRKYDTRKVRKNCTSCVPGRCKRFYRRRPH